MSIIDRIRTAHRPENQRVFRPRINNPEALKQHAYPSGAFVYFILSLIYTMQHPRDVLTVVISFLPPAVYSYCKFNYAVKRDVMDSARELALTYGREFNKKELRREFACLKRDYRLIWSDLKQYEDSIRNFEKSRELNVRQVVDDIILAIENLALIGIGDTYEIFLLFSQCRDRLKILSTYDAADRQEIEQIGDFARSFLRYLML